MSKYPNNPFWDHELDIPVTLYGQGDWDEAEEGGFITAEHALERAERMLLHALAPGGPAAYDEEGFFRSLLSDSTREEFGIKLVVHSNDHDPPHCHVKFHGVLYDKLRIDLTTGEFLDDPPDGIRGKDLKQMKEVFTKYEDQMTGFWDKRFYEGPTNDAP